MTLRTITFDDEQWQVVPREPTEDMLLRGYSALMAWDARTGDDNGIREVFRAMLAAAPEPPAQEPMTDEEITSVCCTYRHDFGLLHERTQRALMREARHWADAFGIGKGESNEG